MTRSHSRRQGDLATKYQEIKTALENKRDGAKDPKVRAKAEEALVQVEALNDYFRLGSQVSRSAKVNWRGNLSKTVAKTIKKVEARLEGHSKANEPKVQEYVAGLRTLQTELEECEAKLGGLRLAPRQFQRGQWFVGDSDRLRAEMGSLTRLSNYLSGLRSLQAHYDEVAFQVKRSRQAQCDPEIPLLLEALECAQTLLGTLIKSVEAQQARKVDAFTPEIKIHATNFFQYLVDQRKYLATWNSFSEQVTSINEYTYHFGVYLTGCSSYEPPAARHMKTISLSATDPSTIDCDPVPVPGSPEFPATSGNSLSQLACVDPGALISWLAGLGCTGVTKEQLDPVLNTPNPRGALFLGCGLNTLSVRLDDDPTDISIVYIVDGVEREPIPVPANYANRVFTTVLSFFAGAFSIQVEIRSAKANGIPDVPVPVVEFLDSGCSPFASIDSWPTGDRLRIDDISGVVKYGFLKLNLEGTNPQEDVTYTISGPGTSDQDNGTYRFGDPARTLFFPGGNGNYIVTLNRPSGGVAGSPITVCDKDNSPVGGNELLVDKWTGSEFKFGVNCNNGILSVVDIVAQTFTYTGAIGMIGISGAQFDIPVSDVGTLLSVDRVKLSIQNDWAGDLDVDLITPSGTSFNLFNNIGGSGGFDNQQTFTINDKGVLNMFEAFPSGVTPPVGETGPHKASIGANDNFFNSGPNSLVGESINGTWVLNIVDTIPIPNEDGQLFLNEFTLTFF